MPSFGPDDARLLVLGLAPGRMGAHRTGRAFTGDASGPTLYAALAAHGFTRGTFDGRPDDGLDLVDCMVSNAVRCVPPANRPTAAETAGCRPYLAARLAALPRLRAVLCLGRVAHEALLRALGARLADHPFAHGARHAVSGLAVFDSYHCSRYNMNTGRLTPQMFHAVVGAVAAEF
ncbi:uracil-DNA glycosylase family protein [Halovulum marinum]|uniref:uracil-DNA glycosylase family protein n=1 Tax=Halovulum marinum TaxID=2662447 RepID=UPI002D77C794|nr:uracil-DNA glycosylase family protein [Halovulum marinum]